MKGSEETRIIKRLLRYAFWIGSMVGASITCFLGFLVQGQWIAASYTLLLSLWITIGFHNEIKKS